MVIEKKCVTLALQIYTHPSSLRPYNYLNQRHCLIMWKAVWMSHQAKASILCPAVNTQLFISVFQGTESQWRTWILGDDSSGATDEIKMLFREIKASTNPILPTCNHIHSTLWSRWDTVCMGFVFQMTFDPSFSVWLLCFKLWVGFGNLDWK